MQLSPMNNDGFVHRFGSMWIESCTQNCDIVDIVTFPLTRDRLFPDEHVHVEQVKVLVMIKVLPMGASWFDVFGSEFHFSACLPCPFASFVSEIFIHLGEIKLS